MNISREQNHHNAEHYDNEWYQRTVELERGCNNGMTADEVYRREATFALQASHTEFKPGEGILDVACGAGNHSKVMSDVLGGRVSIVGVDRAEHLVGMANSMQLQRKREGVREHLRFMVGDMADITPASLDKGIRYKLITILGSSFIYLSNAATRKTLRALYAILEPGGTLVIQSRERPQTVPYEEVERITGPSRQRLHMSKRSEVLRGQKTEVYRDDKHGDEFYHYDADAEHPDRLHSSDYEKVVDHGHIGYKDRDGIEYRGFGRVYRDVNGKEHDLGVTTYNYFVRLKNFKTAKAMLENAGFRVEDRDGKPLEDPQSLGAHRLYAIVAHKPSLKEGAFSKDIQYWEERL